MTGVVGDSAEECTASWSAPEVIATDLDGTLVRTDGTISARSVRALRTAREAGARVVLVTARPPRTVERLLGQTGWFDAIAICSNGALVYDLAHKSVIESSTVPVAVASAAAQALDAHLPEVTWAVETGHSLVQGPGWGRSDPIDRAFEIRVATLSELWGHPVVKLLGWSAAQSSDQMLSVARRLSFAGIEVTHSGGQNMIEISAAGVTKAHTLASCCEDWGMAPGDVVAFGDMPNDVPMLRWAGRSWAVSGAHPDAMAASSGTTASNDDDGVARILEQLFA